MKILASFGSFGGLQRYPQKGWSRTLASASQFYFMAARSQWPLSSIAKTKESFTDFMAQTKDESSKDLLLLARRCIATAVVPFKQK